MHQEGGTVRREGGTLPEPRSVHVISCIGKHTHPPIQISVPSPVDVVNWDVLQCRDESLHGVHGFGPELLAVTNHNLSPVIARFVRCWCCNPSQRGAPCLALCAWNQNQWLLFCHPVGHPRTGALYPPFFSFAPPGLPVTPTAWAWLLSGPSPTSSQTIPTTGLA